MENQNQSNLSVKFNPRRWSKNTVIIAFIGVFFLGIGSIAKDRYDDLQIFAKVLNLVQQYYVEEVDTKKLIYGGIKGMLRELDPHTNFLPPDIYKEFESETSGEFGGLGVEITVQKGVLTVISPIEDTPAYLAGIKAGDKIVTINGESTKGLSLAEASQKMRGPMGAKIILGIYREGFEKPKDFTVVRGTVKIKSVKYTDLDEGYAYVKITSFIENTGKDFKKELKAHLKKYSTVRGLILDLRKNPGGLLDQAVEVCDMFLDRGPIVSTMDRTKKDKQTIYAKKEETLDKFPMVVLIDEYSASASEIVAGAMQDNKRALIMGQRSFGKGSVQSVVRLGDGSGLKLTVARYYTPSGRTIQAEGITPDVVVENLNTDILNKAAIRGDVQREKDIRGHLEQDAGFEGYDDEDSDSPLKKEAREKKSEQKKNKNMMKFWWGEDEETPESKSAKAKLLQDDFQVMQAYNYLRAWKVMKNFDVPEVAKAKPTDKTGGEDANQKQ